MKKNLKKIFAFIITFLACFSTMNIALAESAPNTLTITSYSQSNIPMSFPTTFRVKKTNDGRYSYCSYYAKTPPSASVGYTRGSQITDNGIHYILKEAYSANNDSDFFVYQTALWVYMVDKGIMPQPYADLTAFKSQLNNSNSATANKIKTIVKNAKSAGADNAKDMTVKLSAASTKLHLDNTGEYYVSDKITVTTTASDYTVKFTSAPEGTTYVKSGKTLYIKVPVSKVTNLKTTVSFNVSASSDVYTSYYYNPSNSKYQVMTATYKTTKNSSTNLSVSIQKTASIAIVKVDSSTNKNISGAELQVLNSKGTVIDKWTSTTEAHTVTGLSAGTYTLKETKAPTGYKLSKVQTKFTVNADGSIQNSSGSKITKIDFANDKTGIVISKQDLTSKEELPGATLVIKNSSGKEVVKWVSTNKKHIIKGLAAGTYTLTETIAPDGYTLSTETITFKIDASGNVYDKNGNSVSQIVMYNQKKEAPKEVYISKQDITNGQELPGATLVVKDSNGKEIDKWVSTTERHVIKNLSAGTYTLTETIAPAGYKLSSETITFKIDDKGNVLDKDGKTISQVVMYNQPEATGGGVSISKQDITNGQELPGATLVVKNYDGKVIDTWVSTNTPHLIENLTPGIYTLTETIAPEGYILSTETITFTVKDDGSITKVVMYNSPNTKDIPVENTASFKTITSSIIGVFIVLLGSVIIVKSSKKSTLN